MIDRDRPTDDYGIYCASMASPSKNNWSVLTVAGSQSMQLPSAS